MVVERERLLMAAVHCGFICVAALMDNGSAKCLLLVISLAFRKPNNACPLVSSRTPTKCEGELRTDKGSLLYSQKNSIL